MKSKRIFHPSDLVLRCIALQRSQHWVAMCIDLDLVVQADTASQARKLLREQMNSYVADAVTIDNEHAADLLERKAPLRYILLYHFIKLMHTTRRKQSFETALPLVPNFA
jgi:hypothetical protein